ncbi:DMT family transporter [Corynebacterium sp. MSK122]|uniref:DMT family transporter n=1 Tax=Corynebacterium sp. MSK122 TaxID=3050206 RepID=UPI003AF1D0A7
MIWFLLFLATAIEVSGTLCLRMSAVTGRRFWVVLVALCYVSAYGFLALVLKAGMDLGVAYGIWAATGVALTAIASYLLFKEPFTWLKSLGVVLIVGGVLLVETGA